MPSGKKRKRHKMATHKRKKTFAQEQTQEEVKVLRVCHFSSLLRERG